ncbi:MAG: hypothetical protein KDH16_22780 [Rhodocyclaceae bacterium]|nr:hypothetical protein [Rhodocyclaceae bacterium]
MSRLLHKRHFMWLDINGNPAASKLSTVALLVADRQRPFRWKFTVYRTHLIACDPVVCAAGTIIGLGEATGPLSAQLQAMRIISKTIRR